MDIELESGVEERHEARRRDRAGQALQAVRSGGERSAERARSSDSAQVPRETAREVTPHFQG